MLPPDRVGTVTVPISQTDGSNPAGREEKEEICVQPSSEKLSAVGLFETFAIPWVGPPVPLAPQ